MKDTNTQWHPGFIGAMDLEFKEDRGRLIFEKEHNLNTRPLQIDLLIIRKDGESGNLSNEIGEIFRNFNIIEFKSPEQHLDVDVFYKTESYAGLYKSYGTAVDERKAADITVSIVRETKPEGLFRYFREHGVPVRNPHPGIYYILGEVLFPTQIIVVRELDKGQHSWLRFLSGSVEEEDMRMFLAEVRCLEDKLDRESADSVLEVCLRENRELIEKLIGDDSMSEALLEIMEPKIIEIRRQAKTEGLEQGLERGLEQGLERGLERGKMETARRMLESGRLSVEDIAAYSGLAVEQVHELKKEM